MPASQARFLENVSGFTNDGRKEPGVDPDFIDDWKALDAQSCEADDAMNYTAFNAKANKFGARLKAMFSSDLGHWDVVDFGDVLDEAYEQTEKGLMTDEDFRDFVFVNPARFVTRMNPNYFKGTVYTSLTPDLLLDAK